MASVYVKKQVVRNVNKFKSDFYAYFMDEVLKEVPSIVEFVSDLYNDLLNNRIVDRSSKIRAEEYQDSFLEQFSSYDYVVLDHNGVSLRCPDMTDFPFGVGKLGNLQTILEGMPYEALEIPHEYYERLTGKKPFSRQPFDSSVPIQERIYVERKTNNLINAARNLNIMLAPYAYSKMQPIDIFTLVKEHMMKQEKKWKKEALNKAMLNIGK